MNKKLSFDIYQNALDRKAWRLLIPYPRLMFSYQLKASRENDIKTARVISAISSHMMGLRCHRVCKGPFDPNHRHHLYCKRSCEKIDEFIRGSLRRQLLDALRQKLTTGQQTLDIH